MSHSEPLCQWRETVSNAKPFVESPASKSASSVELWNGTGKIVWHHIGLRNSGHSIEL